MFRMHSLAAVLGLAAGIAIGVPAVAGETEEKELSGMSIVGDHESPKSLVIVPWKSSELGDTLDVSRLLDDGRRPVDRDVFMRQLSYYQLREESHAGSDPAKK
jgi:hypothetical protein